MPVPPPNLSLVGPFGLVDADIVQRTYSNINSKAVDGREMCVWDRIESHKVRRS